MSQRPRIVLVTGSGRSGTSSVAGTLARMGLHVPPPVVEADEANPRGYYEPLWVTEFHKRVLNPVPVRTIDTRPDAARIAMEAGSAPEVEAELRAWLAENLDHPQVLVKDPRAFWILPVWRRVAADLGADVVTLTMLRHPTEVVRSRDTAYLTEQTPRFRRQRETANVAAWVNAAFATEEATRDQPRTFVRYPDLLADWRGAIGRAAEQIGLVLDPPPEQRPHPVDDFVDARLNRSAISWDDLSVPGALRDLGEATWAAMSALVDDPADAAAVADLARLREEYVELFEWSEAIAMDATTQKVSEGRREVRRRKDARIAELQRELDDARRTTSPGLLDRLRRRG